MFSNIGMVNELKELAENLDIDIFEIIKAATKPFGFIPFYPGPGVGVIVFLSILITYHGKQRNTD